MGKTPEKKDKAAVTNRQASRDYTVFETYEAGIVLKGSEVKSIRLGNASLQDSFCKIENNEIFMYNSHISPYEHSGGFKPEPKRKRKLLMHKSEIKKLFGKTTQKGFLLVPLKMYFNDSGLAKVLVGLAKKRLGPDKREYIREKDLEREMRQSNKNKY